jgi:hypothetical protein
VWSSGMTSLSHREDPGFDPQHEHCFCSSDKIQFLATALGTLSMPRCFCKLHRKTCSKHADASDEENVKVSLTKVCLAFTCNDERGHAHRPGLARHVELEHNEFSFLEYQDCEAVCPNFVAAA